MVCDDYGLMQIIMRRSDCIVEQILCKHFVVGEPAHGETPLHIAVKYWCAVLQLRHSCVMSDSCGCVGMHAVLAPVEQ